MAFPHNILFLLIVVYMFYYHCYSQLSLLMVRYLPSMFMKTAIVPMIIIEIPVVKTITGLLLVTALSKNFEYCSAVILKKYLFTHNQQYGCKSKRSTDFCIHVYTVKSVSKYYIQHHSPVYTCFLDASKAFDKINYFKLFRKLLDRKPLIVIVRILLFWYSIANCLCKMG